MSSTSTKSRNNGDDNKITLDLSAFDNHPIHNIDVLAGVSVDNFCRGLFVLKNAPNAVLMGAAAAHSREMVHFALSNGANINAVVNGWSVMGKAASAPLDFFKFLHSLGAKPTEELDESRYALSSVAVCEAHNLPALEYFVTIDPYSIRPLFGGANYSLIMHLLSKRDEHVVFTFSRCFSQKRIDMLFDLVRLGSNLYHPTEPCNKENDLLLRVLILLQESRYVDEMVRLGDFAVYLTAYGLWTPWYKNCTLVNEVNIGRVIQAQLRKCKQVAGTKKSFDNVAQRIKRHRVAMISEHLFALCFALAPHLPALILVEILDQMSWKSALVPFGLKWQCVTTIKHPKTTTSC